MLFWTLGGGTATFRARPYAPWKELLSLMRKVPGSLSFRAAMAAEKNTMLFWLFLSQVCTGEGRTLFSGDAGLIPEPGAVLNKLHADSACCLPVHFLI